MTEPKGLKSLTRVDRPGCCGPPKRGRVDGPDFPEPPDDLKGGVGLAGAGGHDEQYASFASGHRFDDPVDGLDLVIAGLFARAVGVIGLDDQRLGLVVNAAIAFVMVPNGWGWRELVEEELGFDLLIRVGHLVVAGEGVAIGTEGAGHIQDFGIAQGLLHAVTDRMSVVFGFDHSHGHARLPREHVVGKLFLFLIPGRDVATNNDGAWSEGHLAPGFVWFGPIRHLLWPE